MKTHKMLCVDIFMPWLYEGPKQETRKEVLISSEELRQIIETKGQWLIENSFLEVLDNKEHSDTTIIFLENQRSAGFDGLVFWREIHVSHEDMRMVSSEASILELLS